MALCIETAWEEYQACRLKDRPLRGTMQEPSLWISAWTFLGADEAFGL